MTPKTEVEKLMNDLLAFAEKMLGEYGEFHPFGGYLNIAGEIVHVGVQPPSTEQATAQGRVSQLTNSFEVLAYEGKASAFAIATNVTLPLDNGRADAIKFFLEHRSGYCAEVFFRYILTDNAVQITDITAQQGEQIFFPVTNSFLQ